MHATLQSNIDSVAQYLPSSSFLATVNSFVPLTEAFFMIGLLIVFTGVCWVLKVVLKLIPFIY